MLTLEQARLQWIQAVRPVTVESVLSAIQSHPWADAYVPVSEVLAGESRQAVVEVLESLAMAGRITLVADDRPGYGYAAVALR
jgi:hypothetical protein